MLRMVLKRRLLVFALSAIVLAVLVGLVLWASLPWLATRIANQQLGSLDLRAASARVVEVGTGRSLIEEIRLEDEGWQATVDEVSIDYRLGPLWRLRRAGAIEIENPEIVVDVDFLRSLLAESETDAEEEPLLVLDTSLMFPLPVERLVIRDGSLVARDGDRERRASFDGTLERLESGDGRLTVSIEYPDAILELTGNLKREGDTILKLTAQLPRPMELVEDLVPKWRELMEIPNDLAMMLGAMTVSGEVSTGSNGLERASGTLGIASATVRYASDRLESHEVSLGFAMRSDQRVEGQASVEISEAFYEDLSLGSQTARVGFSSANFERWEIQLEQALAWSYDEGFARGTVATTDLSIVIPQGEEPIALSGSADLRDVVVSDYGIDGFRVDFQGDMERVEFATSDIAMQEWPSLRVTDGRGSVLLPEVGPTRVDYAGTVPANWLASLAPELSLCPLDVTVTSESDDDATNAALELVAKPGDYLARMGETLRATGAWRMKAEGNTDAEGILWQGRVSAAGTDMALAGDGWTANGVSQQLDIQLENLNTDRLTAEDVELMELVSEVLAGASGTIDFQASEVAMAEARGQWMSGGIELNQGDGRSDPISLRMRAGAGTLAVATERLQQFSLDTRAFGDLERLAMDGGVGFLYEGIEGKLSFEHVIQGLDTSQLAIEGRYDLSPLVFDYSDLLSRRIDALEGMSFSGAFSASGEYWMNDEGSDADALVRVENASFSHPGSQLSAEGIGAELALQSVMEVRTEPGESNVVMGRLQLGDVVAEDGLFRFDLDSPERLKVLEAWVDAMGGRLALESGEVDLATLNYRGRVGFYEISLSEVTRNISFFDGRMEGAVSGYLPLNLVDGQFQLGEGKLQLASSESAILYYDAEGLLTGEEPGAAPEKPTLGERILEKLGLQPEELVEDALGHFEIKRLEVLLFPADQPLTPIQITLEGVGHTPKADLPLVMQVNVNGGLEDLYTFLVRLSSLGSASF